jgi:hypothetical protein
MGTRLQARWHACHCGTGRSHDDQSRRNFISQGEYRVRSRSGRYESFRKRPLLHRDAAAYEVDHREGGVFTRLCSGTRKTSLARRGDRGSLAGLYETRKSGASDAERRLREIFARLGLELHPDKARQVDLSRGREGFAFLDCHSAQTYERSAMGRPGTRIPACSCCWS